MAISDLQFIQIQVQQGQSPAGSVPWLLMEPIYPG